ncbi:redox-sensing transcriptional repressor Rex [Naumannella cuiyingiana]|uniref:Redox-sensing transcriptional repressor Rex n=1 Tax=Naumannella cuiyingiana TaxID=1347891 RepID=A0A7Z0ILE0_9ACTN|nr:redox-sensing transcriptional repressor [Naumannella cuiyingiana]
MSEPDAHIPDATVARLAAYLGVLTRLSDQGVTTVSSNELAEAAGANPAQLRKDLSHLGSYGVRGVGYDVAYLLVQLDQHLGAGPDVPVIIVGVGNLGRALVNHAGFSSRGFRVVGLVDSDPALAGERVEGLPIAPESALEELIAQTGASIAVITTPGQAAQSVTDRLVASGITGILNFAPAALSVPDSVTVRKVDLGSELQILAYHHRRGPASRTAVEPITASLPPVAASQVEPSQNVSVPKP